MKKRTQHGHVGQNQYRRNRYYDARTGRFTQEDPIGLAGGLNAYGFANGDPVNYSDPFGLCPGIGGLYNFNIFDCPPGYFELLGTLTGALVGGGSGALTGLVVAAPTGESASPVTVPLFSAYGAAEGAITGFGMGASLDAAVHMSKADRSSSGQGEARPERQRLSGGEIKKLKQAGLDPEELKQFDGKADLF